MAKRRKAILPASFHKQLEANREIDFYRLRQNKKFKILNNVAIFQPSDQESSPSNQQHQKEHRSDGGIGSDEVNLYLTIDLSDEQYVKIL